MRTLVVGRKTLRQSFLLQAWLGLCLLLVAGFAWAQGKEIAPTATDMEIPDRNTEAEAKRGETAHAIVRVFTYAGIKLLKPIHGTQPGGRQAGRPTADIDPQYLIARSADENWTYYSGNVQYRFGGATNVTGELDAASSQTRVGGIRINKENSSELEIWVSRHKGRGFMFDSPPEFEDATIGAGDEKSEAKELVFEGIDGEELLFTYREHFGSSAEPTHEESVKLTMAGGSVVTFKDARIEILDVNNDSLRYRVLDSLQ